MRWDEAHQETDKNNQVEMIQILCLIEQEDVAESKKEQDGRDPVERADHDAEGEDAKERPMPIHTAARPWRDPFEPMICKVKIRFDIIARNPTVIKVPPDLDHHDEAERHSKENERRDVYRLE